MRCLLTIVLTAVCAFGLADDPKTSVAFADKFDSKLADGWSWTKENPHGWRVEKNALLIKTAPGTIWDKSAANVLWHNAGKLPEDGTWIAEVSLAHQPETEYEQAGLICSLDDANFFILNIERYHNQRSVVAASRVAGKFSHLGYVEDNDETVRLRIANKDTSVKLQWRQGDEWKTLKEFDFPATGELKIGLHAHGSKNETDDRWAKFTDFQILQEGG